MMSEPGPDFDLRTREGVLRRNTETTDARIPLEFRAATATIRDVTGWCEAFPDNTPPGLLIYGPTGVGKTWQAYGALRCLVAAGVTIAWRDTTAPDLYASLRPRTGVDTEGEFWVWAQVPLLLVDDLGSGKDSEWTEDVTTRLVDYRSRERLPTLFTTNLPLRASSSRVRTLADAIGERAMSRIAGMCAQVAMKGNDRRRAS